MKQISKEQLNALVQARDVTQLSLEDLQQLLRNNPQIGQSLPDGRFEIDPRSGDVVLFVSSREQRPQDTLILHVPDRSVGSDCPICQGQTTGVIDVAPLSQGQTFINKNLFPVFYPYSPTELDKIARDGTHSVRGMHFLQWTSSRHDVDWHNLPLADGFLVMKRLAMLEKTLLGDEQEWGRRFVVITKNFGRLVGSSLAHGHQQIALSSVMPRRFADNQRFRDWQGEMFSTYMLRRNPQELVVRDYGPAVLMVPYFMRRPLDMMLVMKDGEKSHLHMLDDQELTAVAAAWRDAVAAIMAIMPRNGRETAYNIVTNNGPGAGLYFEFLPYTQEIGGFEHLGLITSEGQPKKAAAQLRAEIAKRDNPNHLSAA